MSNTPAPASREGVSALVAFWRNCEAVNRQLAAKHGSGPGWFTVYDDRRDIYKRCADELEAALLAATAQPEQGIGLCSHCGSFEVRYEVGGPSQTEAAIELTNHAASCVADPKVRRIAELEAQLAASRSPTPEPPQ